MHGLGNEGIVFCEERVNEWTRLNDPMRVMATQTAMANESSPIFFLNKYERDTIL